MFIIYNEHMSTTPTSSPTPENTPQPRASQDVERARYQSLREEAIDDAATLTTDRTSLNDIRERDTNPEDEQLRAEGPGHVAVIRDLSRALRQLANAAYNAAQRAATPTSNAAIDVVPPAFWTTVNDDLDGNTAQDFVQRNIHPHRNGIHFAMRSNLWVRGTDRALQSQLESLFENLQGNFVGNRATCGIAELRRMVDQSSQLVQNMQGGIRTAESGHNARHEPNDAVAAEYIEWRGTEDPEAEDLLGVIRHLQTVVNHGFWQLEHDSGQPTIASRARDIIRQIQRSIIIIGPNRCTVQTMEEVSNALRDLTDAMRVIFNRGERKPDDLRVDHGTDAHEHSVNRGVLYNRLLIGASAALAVLVALAGKAVYDTVSGDKAGKDGTREVQPRESTPKKLTADMWVLLRGERTLVFELPKDIAVDTIRDRYQFMIKPRMGGKQRQAVPVRTSKGWTVQLSDEEVASGGVLISVHQNVEGIWKTASEDTLIATLEPEPTSDTKPEERERVADLSPECRVTIKGSSITVQLPAAITPANIEKKFAFFIAKEGDTPPGRYVSLTQGADGWAGSLTADELAKGEVTLTIWDDSTGRVLPRGAPAKMKLK